MPCRTARARTSNCARWKLLAEKAAQTGVDQQIGPLNPYERRIVHLAVAEFPGVATESVGDAFSKTVLISSRK
jgi:spoIIIJ-associated protein